MAEGLADDRPERDRNWPIIRLFVSSTFSDFQFERDALHRHVFRKLEERCLEEEFQFQAIDLRWGVSSEAGIEHRTMRICFDELRRAQQLCPRPNFLVLLGNRYGWRPLPEEISEFEFQGLFEATLSGNSDGPLIPGAHGKTAEQILRAWYRRDDNVLLPEGSITDPERMPLNYVLQPRSQELGDSRVYTRTSERSPKDTQDWLDVQQVLWNIFNTAFPAIDSGELTPDFKDRFDNVDWPNHLAAVQYDEFPRRAIPQFVRLQGSATEQEIWAGALSTSDPGEHVLAVIREIENRDGFEPRELREFFDITGSGEFDSAAATMQESLRRAVRARVGEDAVLEISRPRLKRSGGRIVVDASTEALGQFCEQVETRLWNVISREIDNWRKPTISIDAGIESSGDPSHLRALEIEVDTQTRFGKERALNGRLGGRENEIGRLEQYLTDGSRTPLVVYGPSGMGKTALLARVALHDLPPIDAPLSSGQPLTIVRFLGTTPASSTVRSLLESLCLQLRLHFPLDDELPTSKGELEEEFHRQLERANPARPIYLFLDGLDQLDDADAGRQLGWLRLTPAPCLPAHLKLVISCIKVEDAKQPAGLPFRRLEDPELDLLRTGVQLVELSPDDALDLMLNQWLPASSARTQGDGDPLGRPHRTLSEEQRNAITRHIRRSISTCRSPLYLKMLYEEARLWHSYDPPPCSLPDSVEGLLSEVIARLASEHHDGRVLVERVLGYLAAARRGLSENELLEVLFADRRVRRSILRAALAHGHRLPRRPRRIPIAVFSQFRFDLAAFLTERTAPGGNVLTLYHPQVARWVENEFVTKADWDPHRRLADYFERQLNPVGVPPTSLPSTRALFELPYQQRNARLWNRAKATLCDIGFLQAKCVAGLAFDLVRDFQTLPRKPFDSTASAELSQRRQFTVRSISLLLRHPSMARLQWQVGWQTPHSLFQGTAILQADITALAWSPDDSRLALGGEDGRVAVWDTRTSEVAVSMHLGDMPVIQLEWLTKGAHLLSSSAIDDDVARVARARIWDTATTECVATFDYNPTLAVSQSRESVSFLKYDSQPRYSRMIVPLENIGADLCEITSLDDFRGYSPIGTHLVANSPQRFDYRWMGASPNGRYVAVVETGFYVIWVGVVDRQRLHDPSATHTWVETGEDYSYFGPYTSVAWSPDSDCFVVIDANTLFLFRESEGWTNPTRFDGYWEDGSQRLQKARFLTNRHLLLAVLREGDPVLLAVDLDDFSIVWEHEGWLLEGQVKSGGCHVIGLPRGIGLLECSVDAGELSCEVRSWIETHRHVAALSPSSHRVAAVSSYGRLLTSPWESNEVTEGDPVTSQWIIRPFNAPEVDRTKRHRLSRDGSWLLEQKVTAGGILQITDVSASQEAIQEQYHPERTGLRLYRSQHPNHFPVLCERLQDEDDEDRIQAFWIAEPENIRRYDGKELTDGPQSDKAAVLSPDGVSLAYGLGGGVGFYDPESSPRSWACRCFGFGYDTPAWLQWSPDSRYLAVSNHHRIAVLDVTALREEVSGTDGAVQCDMEVEPGGSVFSWCPDGSQLFVASGTKIHLFDWDNPSLVLQRTLDGAAGPITNITAVDNHSCVTVSRGRFLARWNLLEEKMTAVLLLAAMPVDFTYVRDQQRLVFVDPSGEVHQLNLSDLTLAGTGGTP